MEGEGVRGRGGGGSEGGGSGLVCVTLSRICHNCTQRFLLLGEFVVRGSTVYPALTRSRLITLY